MASFASRLRPRTLNQALGWLLASVIVPLLLGALVLLVVQTRQERQLALNQLSTLAQTLVHTVDGELDNGRSQLEVLAASPAMDARDWKALHRFAGQVARNTPGSLIGLTGPDGQQLFNTAMPWDAPQPNLWKLADQQKEVEWQGRSLPLSSQNLTREVFATGRVAYSDLYFGLFIERPTLAVSLPVMREGRVAYALTLSFPPALLEELIRSAVKTPGLRAAVVDRRGLVVASNVAEAARLGDKISTASVPAGASAGHYESTARDGIEVRGAYARSENNGFLVRVALPRDEVFTFSRSATAGWLALVVASLAASVLLAGLLGRRISRPLRRLGQAAREGRPPPDAPDSGIDEIDALTQALHAGAEAERHRSEELVVSARRAQAEAALRQADRQKDEFLATLAHELRNPLAPIRSAVEVIRRCAPSDVRVQRARDIIDRQVSHLTRLVDDLLDVSRITLGTVQLRREMLDLVALTTGAAESVRPALETAGLRMEQHLSSEPIPVHGDATRLSQCVVNILNNAVKFTPAGGHVTVRVARRGATAEIEVTDSGIGIAPGSVERIFEPFVQEQLSGSHGNTGLGIGLALTRKLVALHGGTVHAESAGPGQGSTFRIRLPAAAAASAIEAPKDSPPTAAMPGAKVVVVDDNEDAANLLSELLSLSGFDTQVAYTGESALNAVLENAPDAVLLDIGLPDIDGYEVCRKIRGSAGKAPVMIALTGWGQKKDRERAQASGFDAHLTKPADPQRMVAMLKELIAARG